MADDEDEKIKTIMLKKYNIEIVKKFDDNNLKLLLQKHNVVDYDIFKCVMKNCYLECVKYFFENKIIINDDIIFDILYSIKISSFSGGIITIYTKLFNLIEQYHNFTYHEMIALMIRGIKVKDIETFELDKTFYILNEISNLYDIQEKDIYKYENILEQLCKTKPTSKEISKFIFAKKNPIKITQKCLENLAIYGTTGETLQLILDNSDCILTEDLMMKFYQMTKKKNRKIRNVKTEDNERELIMQYITKKYIKQLSEI
jgi:hypothetical protein